MFAKLGLLKLSQFIELDMFIDMFIDIIAYVIDKLSWFRRNSANLRLGDSETARRRNPSDLRLCFYAYRV